MTENELREKMLALVEGSNNMTVLDVVTDLIVACVGRMSPDDRRERLILMVDEVEVFFRRHRTT